jgi:alpha-beta hydrolase superfamily lysophospholipase
MTEVHDLEAINVPTVIVHTKDDEVASQEASKRAAERTPARGSSESIREGT